VTDTECAIKTKGLLRYEGGRRKKALAYPFGETRSNKRKKKVLNAGEFDLEAPGAGKLGGLGNGNPRQRTPCVGTNDRSCSTKKVSFYAVTRNGAS